MDERFDTALKETVTSRRVIAKGAAAGGLATLFAAVATGRVLADDRRGRRNRRRRRSDDLTDGTTIDGSDSVGGPTDGITDGTSFNVDEDRKNRPRRRRRKNGRG